jgi:hypothetical protein
MDSQPSRVNRCVSNSRCPFLPRNPLDQLRSFHRSNEGQFASKYSFHLHTLCISHEPSIIESNPNFPGKTSNHVPKYVSKITPDGVPAKEAYGLLVMDLLPTTLSTLNGNECTTGFAGVLFSRPAPVRGILEGHLTSGLYDPHEANLRRV